MSESKKIAQELIKNIEILESRTSISEDALKNMNRLYSSIWTEACYDPLNESTREFALKLLPHIQALNEEFKFKE